jgi:hypothetical protein
MVRLSNLPTSTRPELGHGREDLPVPSLRFWPVGSYLIIYPERRNRGVAVVHGARMYRRSQSPSVVIAYPGLYSPRKRRSRSSVTPANASLLFSRFVSPVRNGTENRSTATSDIP